MCLKTYSHVDDSERILHKHFEKVLSEIIDRGETIISSSVYSSHYSCSRSTHYHYIIVTQPAVKVVERVSITDRLMRWTKRPYVEMLRREDKQTTKKKEVSRTVDWHGG